MFLSLKNLIRRINIAEKRYKYFSKSKCYTSNPFSFVQNKTYVWVERVKDFNKCGYLDKKKDIGN